MKRAFVYFCLLLISACSAGNGEGLDANGRPIGEGPDPTDEPTLANIQARIFTPICTQCHVGAAAPQGLRLDAANSFADLVGVPSREVGGLNRVEPFDPDNSYLFQKINGTASVGARMPLGGPPLPDEDIQLVRQWISDGALPTVASAGEASKVRGVQMHTNGDLQNVQITFSRQIDTTSVFPSSLSIVRSRDERFGNGDDSAVFDFTIVPAANAYALVVRLKRPDTLPGYYRLSFGDDLPTGIIDASGHVVEPYSVEFQIGPQ